MWRSLARLPSPASSSSLRRAASAHAHVHTPSTSWVLARGQSGSMGKSIPRVGSGLAHMSTSSSTTAKRLQHINEVTYKAGDEIHGFVVQSVTPVPSLHLTAIKLSHPATGAEHIHVARADSNNLFSVGFRTTPKDSTGVSHILEHTALCGSKQYPCRDPFFKMLNRSLSTFMNAFTASDYTMYPFSTCNAKDFENLMGIYLDATFFPLLEEMDFLQEGWRLEHETVDDSSSPLVFRGVVFNEMKGALESQDSLFYTRHHQHLFPDSTYSHVSGGDPLHILDLSLTQLRAFHAQCYHPSNARFMTYGDLPLEPHLQQISSKVLRHFSRSTPDTSIPDQLRWSSPRVVRAHYAPDPFSGDPAQQVTVAESFLLRDARDPYGALVARMTSSLLLDGPSSPMFKALINAGLGADYAPTTGVDMSTKEASFSVGLKKISEEKIPAVQAAIFACLDRVAEEGFQTEAVEAALHLIELGQKHQTTKFGLHVASALMSPWIHDEDPIGYLATDELIARLRKELPQGVLQQWIKRNLLGNPHRLTFIMSPDSDYKKKEETKEQEKLAGLTSGLGDAEKAAIFVQGKTLLEKQNTAQDLSCLPTLHAADIDRHLVPHMLTHTTLGKTPLQLAIQPTNGITYFRALINVASVPTDLLPLLPLFCSVAASLGAGERDHVQLSLAKKNVCGGLHLSPSLLGHHTNPGDFEQMVMIDSHCLVRNLPAMFGLWRDVFLSPRLGNRDHLRTLIKMAAADYAGSLADSAHSYALSLANSGVNVMGRIGDMQGGLFQSMLIQKLAAEDNVDATVEKLQSLATHVLNAATIRCSLNCDAAGEAASLQSLESFLSYLPSSPLVPSPSPTVLKRPPSTFISSNLNVNFAGRCLPGLPYTHPDSSLLSLLANIMTYKFLHREIREKNGAYGGGASSSGNQFRFYSYRDPCTLETVSAFDRSIEWACAGNFNDTDLNEAKLSVFQSLDAPVAPSAYGTSLFTARITDAMRQAKREQLLDAKKEDLVRAAHTYLQSPAQVATVIVGSAQHADKIREAAGWTVVDLNNVYDN